MSVSLSTIFNGYQSLLFNGLPNAGGFIYTYLAGTTTPAPTYTTSAGTIQNANPIPLSAAGVPPNEIWLTDGIAYKFVVCDVNYATLPNGTSDNVTGIGFGVLSAPTGSTKVGFVQSGVGAAGRAAQDKLRESVSSEDYFLASDADQTGQLQRAINAAFAAGIPRVIATTPHALSANVDIASNTQALILDFQGNTISLTANTAGITIRGLSHMFCNAVFSQSSTALTPTAVKVTADALYQNTQYVRLIGLRGISVYRGVDATMPAANQVCYRTTVENCQFENYNLQKTWAGSFGVSFSGPLAGNAAGNDSKIIGTLIKGYERNIIISNSVSTELRGVRVDGGASAVRYDGGSNLRVSGSYFEYNTTIFELVNTPYGLYTGVDNSWANYTNFVTGTLFSGMAPYGMAPLGDFIGGPIDMQIGPWKTKLSTGIAEAYAANGVRVGDVASIANCAPIKGVFSATATLNFGAIAAGGSASQAVSVPGTTANCLALVSSLNGSLPFSSLIMTGAPSVDTVTVFAVNPSTAGYTANNVQVRVVAMKF